MKRKVSLLRLLLHRGFDLMYVGFEPHVFVEFDKPIINKDFGNWQTGEWVNVKELNINHLVNFTGYKSIID